MSSISNYWEIIYPYFLCRNVLLMPNDILHSHEVNCCCLRYNLHLRAVITNQRLFMCKSLNRLLIIKKKALKKEGNWKSQAIQDSSREKTSTY